MIAIVGKPRTGKTTLLKWLILKSKAKQVFILDYHGEFEKISEMRPAVFLFSKWKQLAFFKDKAIEASERAKPSLVIFDEIHMYTKTHKENVDVICEIYRFAGHHDIFLLCATHRIYDLPPDIRAMITKFICFKMTEKRDLDYIKDTWGEPYADLVRGLKKRQFVILSFEA